MPWFLLAWITTLITAAYLGYHYRELVAAVRKIEATLEKRRKAKEQKPESSVLDPYDVVQQAKADHERKMRELNAHIYSDDE